MYEIFNVEPVHQTAVPTPSRWNFIRTRLNANLDKAVSYYRHSKEFVSSQHILIKLLSGMGVPHSLEISRYYDNVCQVALNRSMALGMTSSIFKGRLFHGDFYGDASREIIIGDSDSFDPVWANDNWEDLSPITILRCAHSDISFMPPNGIRHHSETGVAVIAINIPLLAVQYRAFRNKEAEIAAVSGCGERGINNFVFNYPLTNALGSQLDYELFNHLDHVLRDEAIGVSISAKHPFFMSGFEDELREYHEKLIDILSNSKADFYNMMRSIPMINVDNLFDASYLPSSVPTRQIEWAFSVARIPTIEFLFRLSSEFALVRNSMEVGKIARYANMSLRNSLLNTMLPADLYRDLADSYNYINKIAKGENDE